MRCPLREVDDDPIAQSLDWIAACEGACDSLPRRYSRRRGSEKPTRNQDDICSHRDIVPVFASPFGERPATPPFFIARMDDAHARASRDLTLP